MLGGAFQKRPQDADSILGGECQKRRRINIQLFPMLTLPRRHLPCRLYGHDLWVISCIFHQNETMLGVR